MTPIRPNTQQSSYGNASAGTSQQAQQTQATGESENTKIGEQQLQMAAQCISNGQPVGKVIENWRVTHPEDLKALRDFANAVEARSNQRYDPQQRIDAFLMIDFKRLLSTGTKSLEELISDFDIRHPDDLQELQELQELVTAMNNMDNAGEPTIDTAFIPGIEPPQHRGVKD